MERVASYVIPVAWIVYIVIPKDLIEQIEGISEIKKNEM